MPIYEYRCKACGHYLEQIQRMSDPALTDCPACGKRQLRRLISAAGFRLKGGGWYETDFKSTNKRNLVESPDAAGAKSESASKDGTAKESTPSGDGKSGGTAKESSGKGGPAAKPAGGTAPAA